MADVVDPYATARSNLRENVKTMSTILAGTAGAIIAGSPFSGIGTLDPSDLRFWLAVLGLLAVAISLFVGWKILTFTLRPDILYPEILKDSFKEKELRQLGLPPIEEREILFVKQEFFRRRKSLLPPNIDTYEQFERYLDKEWEVVLRLDPEDSKKKKTTYAEHEQNMRNIGYWATFTRLSMRVEIGLKRVQRLGAFGLVALLLFAWAANPPKKAVAAPVVPEVKVVCAACPVAQAVPTARKVLFATNSAEIDATAYEVLNEVAIALRMQPDIGILLLAHTDTVAGERINRELAVRRSGVVKRILLDQGGIAASRIFVSDLPKADLPVLTNDETERQANRSVEVLFAWLQLPPR